MDQGLELLGIEAQFGRDKLIDVNAIQGPTVPLRNIQEFTLALGEGDVKAALTSSDAVEKELQVKGGLAAAGAAFDQVGAIGGIAAIHNRVEPRHPGGNGGSVKRVFRRHWVSEGEGAGNQYRDRNWKKVPLRSLVPAA